jgi:hypothetical protein
MYKIQLLVFCLLSLCSCKQTNNKAIISPSKHYQLQFSINESHTDATKYKCIILKLYNSHRELLSTLQTGVSDYSKWSIGWHPVNDTIIVGSKDIGNYAYRIVNSKNLKEIKITPAFNLLADSIYNKKYK